MSDEVVVPIDWSADPEPVSLTTMLAEAIRFQATDQEEEGTPLGNLKSAALAKPIAPQIISNLKNIARNPDPNPETVE